jgi:hypothetical protein
LAEAIPRERNEIATPSARNDNVNGLIIGAWNLVLGICNLWHRISSLMFTLNYSRELV